MLKFFSSVLLLMLFAVISASSFAQPNDELPLPNIRLTLEAENSDWEAGKPAIVNFSIENLSNIELKLSSSIYFKLDDNTRMNGIHITMANGVFSAPLSLTKEYLKTSSACQNDLTVKRIKKGKKFIAISPPAQDFVLKKDEKRSLHLI